MCALSLSRWVMLFLVTNDHHTRDSRRFKTETVRAETLTLTETCVGWRHCCKYHAHIRHNKHLISPWLAAAVNTESGTGTRIIRAQMNTYCSGLINIS